MIPHLRKPALEHLFGIGSVTSTLAQCESFVGALNHPVSFTIVRHCVMELAAAVETWMMS
jgi:hypothetical protein